jgi:oxygen-independent coproporphyrinogen-3 oxidase
MPETSPVADLEQTEVGSYFVANYPPFSVWTPEAVGTDAKVALESPPVEGVPLGLYLHIPFCRKRCHFCYFRVYTDKNAREVDQYLALLGREWELYADKPALAGRPFNFVYFGGGTPSFLSTRQLETLVKRVTASRTWGTAEEVTFECEPGTITRPKLAAIRHIGVTRLSLGVENFDDRILELNGRAHRSPEIDRVYREARHLKFPQINIDLIAGMLGETDANWEACVRRTIEMEPDSVTIYQMELPYNTTISKDLLKHGGQFADPVAAWAVKRRWVREAFEALERARFLYRDRLWQGADMVGLGVASFGHINKVHVQNLDTWETYSAALKHGEIPLWRAYRPTEEERMIREFVLQLKRGSIRPEYFSDKYRINPLVRFREQLASLSQEGYLASATAEQIALTRQGLLRVDVLLRRFFLPQHTGIRYT